MFKRITINEIIFLQKANLAIEMAIFTKCTMLGLSLTSMIESENELCMTIMPVGDGLNVVGVAQ